MIVSHGLLTGQVLQRLKGGAKATVTGTCESSGAVNVTIAAGKKVVKGWSEKKVGRAADGSFTAKLDGVPVGGPYTVTLSCGSEKVAVANVSVGDVWLLAGQSNMQGCGNLSDAPAPHPKVHAFYMDRHWDVAVEPIHFLEDSPDPVHNTVQRTPAELKKVRKAALKGVGPAVYFGKEMVKRSGGVPQGFICTAHGGTSMQQWSPAKKDEGGKSLYGSMKLSLDACGQPVAGVLWYQGESDANANDAPLYTQRMKELITAIRTDLKQPALPFLLVQIGKFYTFNSDARWWNSVQDQEANLYKHLKNVACASAGDLGLDDAIHIGAIPYERLGIRLARLADYYVYGNKKECPAPEFVSMKRTTSRSNSGVMVLKFKNVVGGFISKGDPNGFTLVDQDHRDTNTVYKTELQGDTIRLEADFFHTFNSNLAYGVGFTPYLNITDKRDMPIPILGPETLSVPGTSTGFLNNWQVSTILPASKSIDAWDAPSPLPEYGLRQKKYDGVFVDNHLEWQNNSGQAVFFGKLDLSQDMKLMLRFGYDAPVRVWVDDAAVFTDMAGINPAIMDAKSVKLDLNKGAHKIAIAMDLNGGKAWGFFARFERLDVTKEQLKKREVVLPKFSS